MEQHAWYLFKVEHPMGTFIGVAKDESDARLHFGVRSIITPIEESAVLVMRTEDNSSNDTVILAI